MPQRVVLVGGDLMARSRVEDTARRAGLGFTQVAAHSIGPTLGDDPSDIIIVDLDSGGQNMVTKLEPVLAQGNERRLAIGYFSHVDSELGDAARRAGLEVYPRGRFWRSLPDIITAAAQ